MEKINIAEILKDCPKGMELNCVLFENVTFEGIKQDEYPIIVKIKEPPMTLSLTKNGGWNSYNSAKCVIYPKGKTTWEGFIPPYKFKDGDVLVHTQNGRFIMSIYKSNENEKLINTHIIFWDREEGLSVGMQFCCYTDNVRFATEEERQKLFDAIKDNGYRWDEETKTLKKLPKFKVGDQIVKKNSISNSYIVNSVSCEYYGLLLPYKSGVGVLNVNEQDEWELLVTTPKFKVGDRIKNRCCSATYRVIGIVEDGYKIDCFSCTIPFSLEDSYELVPNKFDISTLKPFDKVLVRQNVSGKWGIDFFGFYNEGYYYSTGNCMYVQCIPYEKNEHLLGTTQDCDEFYKNW